MSQAWAVAIADAAGGVAAIFYAKGKPHADRTRLVVVGAVLLVSAVAVVVVEHLAGS